MRRQFAAVAKPTVAYGCEKEEIHYVHTASKGP